MHIKIGDKIKELRKLNERTQEDLAVALGVTNQAVSRWESNGGYPDMEMIPGIANYFHITIDELFGYDNDREIKLKSYVDQANQMLRESGDMAHCVEFLRNAISEFPSEGRLQFLLAVALPVMGMQKYGCDDMNEAAQNSLNEYRKEAISLYEKIMKMETDADTHNYAVANLMSLYSDIGDYEAAEKMALSQSPVHVCRELLLLRAAEGEKKERYQGEAILALIHELKDVIEGEVLSKRSLSNSQTGLEKLLAVIQLYDSILDDGNCGAFHSDLCLVYLRCSQIASCLNDFKGAMNYFDAAFDHFTKFTFLDGRNHQFTAPLVSKVPGTHVAVALLPGEVFEGYIKTIPEELADAIKGNPKYSQVFSQ